MMSLFVHHARSRATLRLQRPNTRLRDSQGHRGIERTMRPRVAHGLRRSDPGRACGQGPAPIAHHCYCTRFAASAGAIRAAALERGGCIRRGHARGFSVLDACGLPVPTVCLVPAYMWSARAAPTMGSRWNVKGTAKGRTHRATTATTRRRRRSSQRLWTRRSRLRQHQPRR